MNSNPHVIAALRLHLLAVVCAGFVCPRSYAQEDPFGAAPKPAGEEAPASTAAKKTAARPETVESEPLIIELLRASNPSSPEQLLSAAQSALQFGRPDESKKHLTKFLEDKPTDEAIAPLTARYGPFLLQLGSTKELQPEGQQVAEMVLSAAQRVAQDQARIAAAIEQLSSSDTGDRHTAMEPLTRAGIAAVNPMLHALADSARAAEHANIRLALVQLGSAVELPLIAALDTKDDSLKAQIIAVLGRMGSTRAAVFLIRHALDPATNNQTRELAAAALKRLQGAAPDLYEAQHYLSARLPRLLSGDLPFEADQNDRVSLWSWDESSRQVVAAQLPRKDAGLLLAARIADDLYVLTRGDQTAQRLMLLTNLELAKVLGGFDRPISTAPGSAGAVALASGPRVMSQVLADALKMGRSAAATAAAELLGLLGDASILQTSGDESPLAQALRSSDRRVRLAAALAAVQLAPGEPFAGAGRLGDTLAWFVATSGANSVLIGHPRGEEAQSLVGFVNALGYEGEGAYAGRVLAERAFVNPDFAFILISDAIDGPPVEELVQWLRRDYRTARQPIGVMARGPQFLRLQEAFADDPFTTVFPRIHSVDVCSTEVNKLKSIAGRDFVDRDERLAQARAALSALDVLAKRPPVFAQYDILRQQPTIIGALGNPALTAEAAALLVHFPTPAAQTALVDFASQANRPLADRQAAANAFAASVRARGLLLNQSQVTQQYARYNASQSADKSTQDLLGSILDAIEAPALARGELRKQP